MTKLKWLGAAAVMTAALATPVMAQEATQEPGMIGFSYPNSNYLRGGYGVHLPSRYDHGYYGPRAYSGGYGVSGGYAVAPLGGYDSYAQYGYGGPGYW